MDTVAGRHNMEREIKATRGAMNKRRKRRELLLFATAMVLFLSFLYYLTRERSDSAVGKTAPPALENTSHRC